MDKHNWEGQVVLVKRLLKHGNFDTWHIAIAVEPRFISSGFPLVILCTLRWDFTGKSVPFFTGQLVSGLKTETENTVTFYRDGYRVACATFEDVDQ